jgi:hypothetical protein
MRMASLHAGYNFERKSEWWVSPDCNLNLFLDESRCSFGPSMG